MNFKELLEKMKKKDKIGTATVLESWLLSYKNSGNDLIYGKIAGMLWGLEFAEIITEEEHKILSKILIYRLY